MTIVQRRLSYEGAAQPARSISPWLEMGAYEALWAQPGMSFKRMADIFREQPEALPSDLVEEGRAQAMAEAVLQILRDQGVERFGVRIHRAGEYPPKLRHARNPVELLYHQGFWNWVERRAVAVVGTRKATAEGVRRTRRLVKALVEDEITIVSGLAAGIDTAAHTAALDYGGPTMAVLGTPLSSVYPRENRELQRRIAAEYLVISQVPVWLYHQRSWRANRSFFPERNITMSALTEATIIVEAGETSGTLIQARAALEQGRKLLILESCFEAGLDWPRKFEQRGAIRVATPEDVRKALGAELHPNR